MRTGDGRGSIPSIGCDASRPTRSTIAGGKSASHNQSSVPSIAKHWTIPLGHAEEEIGVLMTLGVALVVVSVYWFYQRSSGDIFASHSSALVAGLGLACMAGAGLIRLSAK